MFSSNFIRSQYANLPIQPPSSVSNRTYIVTGANTGLGFECAQHLVRLNASRVILTARSQERGNEAKAQIEAATGRKNIAEVWLLDLSSHSSVKAFAKRACQELERIDGVIENAGVALDQWTLAEGMEMTLTVNVMSTFLLAMLLLPKMKETAKKTGEKSHLVIVSSDGAFWMTNKLEPFEGNIIESLNTKGRFTGSQQRYPLTKLLQAYATRELAALLPASKSGVIINYISPGMCRTSLSRNAPLAFRIMLRIMWMLLGRTAEMGSRTLLHAVCADKESHGKYLDSCKVHEDHVPTWVTSDQGRRIQKEIWKSITDRLEDIEQGCVKAALES